jgi:hypothetical protein
VLNLHNKHSYITAIEKDGIKEEIAFNNSLVQVNKIDIKSINKMSDGTATIIMKKSVPPFETIEGYDEILDTIQKANIAVDIMRRDKVYIFDDFDVDSDELDVIQNCCPNNQ